MKKYLYIFVLLLGIVYLASCSDHERTTYDQGNEVQVLFPVNKMAFEVVEADMDSFIVKVYRSNIKGTLEAPIKLDLKDLDTELGFELDSSSLIVKEDKSVAVLFQDGKNVADIVIRYNYEKLGLLDKYVVELSLTDEDQFPLYPNSGSAAYTNTSITVSRKLTFKQVTENEGSYSSSIFGQKWAQIIERAEEDPTVYRLPDCYSEGYHLVFVMDKDLNVTFNPMQPTGYEHSNDTGMTYFYVHSASVKDNKLTINARLVFYDKNDGELYALTNAVDEVFTFPDNFFD